MPFTHLLYFLLFAIPCLLDEHRSVYGQDGGNRTHGRTDLSDTQPVMPSEAAPMAVVYTNGFGIGRYSAFENGHSW